MSDSSAHDDAAHDDTLRDAIALARAMLTEDHIGARAVIDNTPSKGKARKASWCPACQLQVIVGQHVALVPGRGWLHVTCAIGGQRAASAGQQ